jgi:hypothetical protein
MHKVQQADRKSRSGRSFRVAAFKERKEALVHRTVMEWECKRNST